MQRTTNLLFESLPSVDLSDMLAATEAVLLPVRTILYEPSVPPRYAYFLTDGIASIVTNTTSGQVIEVGIVGREGLSGALHLMGNLNIPTQCFMQITGSGRRMLLSDLKETFASSESMRNRILEFNQFTTINAQQLSTCNAIHTIEQRLARWLLNIQDRMPSEHFSLTQQFLSEMLAVHRPTISVVAGQLQQQGIITYKYGLVQILQSEKLAAIACECHGVSFALLQALYSQEHSVLPFRPNNGHGEHLAKHY